MAGGINSNVIQSIRSSGVNGGGGKAGGRNLNAVFGAEEKKDRNALNQIFGNISGSNIKNIISQNRNAILQPIMGAASGVNIKDKKNLDEIFTKLDKKPQVGVQVIPQVVPQRPDDKSVGQIISQLRADDKPRIQQIRPDDKHRYKDMLAEIVGGKVVSDIQLIHPLADKQQQQQQVVSVRSDSGEGVKGGVGKQQELIQERKKLLNSVELNSVELNSVEEYSHLKLDNTNYIILAIIIVIVMFLFVVQNV